jgi:hypothetical protein
MTTKQTLIACAVTLIVGVSAGRFTLPAKVVTKIEVKTVLQTVETEKKADTSHIVTTVTETRAPDGTVTKSTKTEDNVDIVTGTKLSQSDSSDQKSVKEVTYQTSRWTLQALTTIDFSAKRAYGGEVSYRILGPFSVSALGLSNGSVGVGLGITF